MPIIVTTYDNATVTVEPSPRDPRYKRLLTRQFQQNKPTELVWGHVIDLSPDDLANLITMLRKAEAGLDQ